MIEQNSIDKSVEFIDHDVCCGCMMCGDICPHNAISFKIDAGFWFPSVDKTLCVNCGLCSQKCPVLHVSKQMLSAPKLCYGAKSLDEIIRDSSTSGGVFSVIAKEWIEEGGYCAGAIYSENNAIMHFLTNKTEDISRLRQSKYAQSNTQGIYKQVKKILNGGGKVLFCGTPCQVEALYSYLGSKAANNLFTIDFVCLGIGSPVVYREYLKWLEKRYKSKIIKVWFKNKEEGWRAVGTKIIFENGKEYYRPGNLDLFMIPFTFEFLSIRESCSQCKFRRIPHNSDLTIGDFWGVEKVNPKIDDNKGISAIIANTDRGLHFFESIRNQLNSFETTVQDICNGNTTILQFKSFSPYRDLFLRNVEKIGIQKAVARYSSFHGWNKVKRIVSYKKIIIKKMIIKYGKNIFSSVH